MKLWASELNLLQHRLIIGPQKHLFICAELSASRECSSRSCPTAFPPQWETTWWAIDWNQIQMHPPLETIYIHYKLNLQHNLLCIHIQLPPKKTRLLWALLFSFHRKVASRLGSCWIPLAARTDRNDPLLDQRANVLLIMLYLRM